MIQIEPFFIEKLDDSFLETGIRSFLEEDVSHADLIIERVFENEKHGSSCLIKERELRVILSV